MSTCKIENGNLTANDPEVNKLLIQLVEKMSKSCVKNKKAIEKLLNNEVVVTIAMNIEPKL